MSGITSGIGLASGINTGQIIEQLLAIDARAKQPIQTQITRTQTSKTALLDVNARLLGLRSASTKFRVGRVFEQMKSVSSDDAVLTTTVKPGTPPGTYSFNVSRLVSTSQYLSRGFGTRDATPLGMTSMTFEFGDAAISRQVLLNTLRGGEGVGQGSIRLTDRTGGSATVDLSSAVTLQDVVEKINEVTTVSIDAAIENERLVLRDTSGGAGAFSVANVGGGTIGTRLGLVGSVAGSVITGASLSGLSMVSSLNELNDGAGVLIRDGSVDFKISNGATTYDISLGRQNLPITSSTLLSDLNNGVGVRINNTDADDFTVVTSTGVNVGINLGAILSGEEVTTPAVKTVGEMMTRVNARLADALGSPTAVVLSLRADGKGFNVTDTLGGAGPVQVLGAGPNADRTARDLGIYTGAITTGTATIIGDLIQNKAAKPRAASIQDIADRVFEQTSGMVRVEINAAGTGIRLVSTDSSTLTVLPGVIDGSSFGAAVGERTARDLGIVGLGGASVVDGTRISSGVGTVRTANLNGGKGIPAGAVLNITARNGVGFTFNTFGAHETLDSLVTAINAQATASGVGVSIGLGDSGRSLVVRDTSGGTGNLTISGTGADALGIQSNQALSSVRGGDLERQYISMATSLASLNFGKGVGTGTFTLTDSNGVSGTIDIDSSDVTVYDLISEINAQGLLLEARINETGDGIILVDTNTGTPAQAMEVKDTSGTVARSLGIARKAAAAGDDIDGTFERTVTLLASDTMNDVVGKIKAAGIGVNAAIINAGSGGTPFRLSLTSQYAGTRGQLLIDTGSVDLGLARTAEGRDAALVLGGAIATESPFVFTSNSNTFEDILSGLQVTAKKTGSATVEVASDVDGMIGAVQSWVKAMNDLLTKIGEYDKFDSTTNVKGPLFGNGTVSIVRLQLLSTIQSKPRGVDGQFQFLSQLGIKVGAKSQVTFDVEKFRGLLESDPASVEKAFAAFEIEAVTTSSPVEGVTITGDPKTVYRKLGFGDLVDQMVQRLTNTIDGTTTVADRNFQRRIEGLNQRIKDIDARIAAKRIRYERQFAAMERAISRTQSQQSALASLPTSF